ncbi:MAG: hypothetical protein MUC92_10240 [Fimbriimonadaceae bacterium]|jgi:hypothetical protein|nr:hypothetical protein [Fimbriimonadaceae bacterium]
MILSSLVALSLVHQQAQPLVSITVMPTHPQKVLNQLGEKIGRKLTAGPNIRQDYFMIHFTDKSADHILKVIGESLEGEWSPLSDGSLMLDRKPKPESDENLRELAQKLHLEIKKQAQPPSFSREDAEKLVSSGIQFAQKAAENPESVDWQDYQRIRSGTPDQVYLANIMALLDPMMLVQLPAGESIWIANTGMKRHIPFTSQMVRLLRQMEADHKMVESIAIEAMKKVDRERIPSYFDFMQAVQGDPREDSPEVTYAVSIRKLPLFGNEVNLQVQLHRFQGAGSRQFFAFYSSSGTAMEMGRSNQDQVVDSIAKGLTQKVVISPEVKPFVDSLPSMMRGNFAENESSPWPRVFSDLDRKDMLEYFAGELPLQVAQAKGRDLVAVIPDVALFGLLQVLFSVGESTLEASYGATRDIYGSRQTDDGFTIVIRPTHWNPDERLDREKIKKIYALSQAKRELTLDDYAELALLLDERETSAMILQSVLILTGTMDQSTYSLPSNDSLRLYGTLSVAQRQQVRAKGLTLNYSALTNQQKYFVTKMAFSQNSQVMTLKEVSMVNPNTDHVFTVYSPESNLTAFERQPGLLLGNGVPNETLITLRITNTPSIFARQAPEEGRPVSGTAPIDVRTLAWQIVQAENRAPGRRGWPPVYDAFAYTNNEVLSSVVQVGKDRAMRFGFQTPVARSVKFGPMSSLPDKIRTELESAIAEIRKDPNSYFRQQDAPPASANP